MGLTNICVKSTGITQNAKLFKKKCRFFSLFSGTLIGESRGCIFGLQP